MTQTMDAHSSFVYLVDNLPTWQAKVTTLSDHVALKNADFVAEYTRLVNQIKPKRRKSPSVASIHTHDEQKDEQNDAASLADVPAPEINPLEAGTRYLYAQAGRKRKPTPSVRSGASGPQKYRHKNQVVVYYDGFLQGELDALVKSIGIGRNNLRKGKLALAAARGFRLPTLTPRAGQGYTLLESVRGGMISQSTPALLSGKKDLGASVAPAADESAIFIQVDKELELVQSLCETAAHQFLRDGDCKTEFANVQQKLEAILAKAVPAVESLKKIQEESQSQDTSEADSDIPLPFVYTSSPGIGLMQPSLNPFGSPKAGIPGLNPLSATHPLEYTKSRPAILSAPNINSGANAAGLLTDDIEVDDTSDQGSIVLDISQYRLTNARRTRI